MLRKLFVIFAVLMVVLPSFNLIALKSALALQIPPSHSVPDSFNPKNTGAIGGPCWTIQDKPGSSTFRQVCNLNAHCDGGTCAAGKSYNEVDITATPYSESGGYCAYLPNAFDIKTTISACSTVVGLVCNTKTLLCEKDATIANATTTININDASLNNLNVTQPAGLQQAQSLALNAGYQTDHYKQLSYTCNADISNFLANVGWFAVNTIFIRGSFLAANIAISALDKSSVNLSIPVVGGLGVNIAGFLEPFNNALDFITNQFDTAMIWGVVATFVNWMSGWLINFAIDLNNEITISPVLAYGSDVILGLVNFAFIIALIMIAITTILRLGSWSTDKLLFRLVFAMIMVNLTLLMATTLLNIGTKVTKAMYVTANPCPGVMSNKFSAPELFTKIQIKGTESLITSAENDIKTAVSNINSSANLGNGTSLNVFKAAIDVIWENIKTLINFFVIDFLALIFADLISIVGALTFLTLAIFLFLRYVVLTLLLLVSPAIWISYIVKDGTKGLPGSLTGGWSKWWSQFLCWTFFGPVIVFFIALGNQILDVTIQSPTPLMGYSNMKGLLEMFAQLICFVIIMGIGLYIAKKGSCGAGNAIMGGITAGWGALSGGIGRVFAQPGVMAERQRNRLSDLEARKAAGENISDADIQKQRSRLATLERLKTAMPSKIGGVPGSAAFAKYTGIKPPETKIQSGKEILDAQFKAQSAKFSGKADSEIINDLSNTSGPAQAAAIAELTKRGKMEDARKAMGEEKWNKVMSASTRTNLANFGQGTAFADMEKQTGMSLDMHTAMQSYKQINDNLQSKIAAGTATTDDHTAAATAHAQIKISTQQWAKTLKPDDIKKLPLDRIFSTFDPSKSTTADLASHNEMKFAMAGELIKADPGNYKKILDGVKPENLARASREIDVAADIVISEHQNQYLGSDQIIRTNMENVKRQNAAYVNKKFGSSSNSGSSGTSGGNPPPSGNTGGPSGGNSGNNNPPPSGGSTGGSSGSGGTGGGNPPPSGNTGGPSGGNSGNNNPPPSGGTGGGPTGGGTGNPPSGLGSGNNSQQQNNSGAGSNPPPISQSIKDDYKNIFGNISENDISKWENAFNGLSSPIYRTSRIRANIVKRYINAGISPDEAKNYLAQGIVDPTYIRQSTS